MKIISPIASGNGAHVVHKMLAENIKNYQLISYHPYRTLFPPSLFSVGKNIKADLVHTYADYGYFHAHRNVPLFLTFHGFALDNFMRPYLTRLQNLHRLTDLKLFTALSLKRADYISAVSQYTANKVKKELNLNQEIKVIYNGVDHQRFIPSEKRIKQSNKIKVLFCGNLGLRKGTHWLPLIAEKLPKNIVIQYTSGLRNIPASYSHSNLQCLGKVNYLDMHQIYQQADIFLFPSVREGFGLVIAEAMSCGLPVVSSNCSAIPELVHHERGGILCEIGNIQQFVDGIKMLAENPPLRKEYGEYNREKVCQKFTLMRMALEYREYFDEALSIRQ
ncbi:glycosyltransferase family 4 protein [Aliikangiella maris]|uniref:Glycosyltransferase family 4 protein n=2 Tax=Aliikangiella maris TaxID=3162458 RepID=A0ABV3MMI0_9GAMM